MSATPITPAQAQQQARELLAKRAELGAAWLDWVAAQLFACPSQQHARAIRRALQELMQG
ncbi:hypothetical protein [Atopomonas hussainii]|uniref:hypothetical protein n=1 Tax=Atopomonas hussainii TaxID=1429083 RepID=UPI0009001390|nr:hypothetical protein [Atopomonas hussainii]